MCTHGAPNFSASLRTLGPKTPGEGALLCAWVALQKQNKSNSYIMGGGGLGLGKVWSIVDIINFRPSDAYP